MVSVDDMKLPPHNVEAEKGLLCCVLLDNDVLFLCDDMFLAPEDFYQKEHKMIFEAMKELRGNRKTIDVITLADALVKLQYFELVGGNDYLYEISTSVMTTSVGKEYSRIVKEKSILRSILKVSQAIIGDVYEQKDTVEIVDTIQKRIFDLTQFDMTDSTKHIKEILEQRVEEHMELVDNPDKINEHKVMSGYVKLDDVTNGFKPGELIVIAARPSMGKTAFALNLLLNAALKHGKSAVFFSMEMGSEQIVDRLLSAVSEIHMSRMQKGQLNESDFAELGEAMEKLGDTSIFIDDQGGATIPALKSKLRKIKIERGSLDLVIIDYLQLMNGSQSKFAGNRVQEISEISRGLKELARELKIPIIALSQLSRNVEARVDKRPQLADLRESGAIEQDADTVIMLYRDEYYDPDTDRKGTADIIIRKNRNGQVADIELMFKGEIQKFYDIQKP